MERPFDGPNTVLAGLWSMKTDRGIGLDCPRVAAYHDEAIRLDPGDVGSNPPFEGLRFAFMESLCIYGLEIALAILFANLCTLASARNSCLDLYFSLRQACWD